MAQQATAQERDNNGEPRRDPFSKNGKPCSYCPNGTIKERNDDGHPRAFCDVCGKEHHFVDF